MGACQEIDVNKEHIPPGLHWDEQKRGFRLQFMNQKTKKRESRRFPESRIDWEGVSG
jgi:hypothetical protein